MSADVIRRKRILFVDDDPQFLMGIRPLFGEMSKGSWEVLGAENHAVALSLLSKERIDLVVLDIGMPVMDGIQFLQLLGRTHPGQQVAMLTGRGTEERRKACFESGAVLFLEKPLSADGFTAIYAALDSVAGAQPQGGFHGMMRRVGLQEVLQMECLGRKSSVLEIFTARVRGRIFICDGSIIHADAGELQGEGALYNLLALQGGAFNLLPFLEPRHRTINGQWEFLLMEAARLRDETAVADQPGVASTSITETKDAAEEPRAEDGFAGIQPDDRVQIDEVVLCSGGGELLYESGSPSADARLRLLQRLEAEAAPLSALAPLGRFDRIELYTLEGRIVCQVQLDRRLFVRSSRATGSLV